mmetsp:Transcript_77843/g.170512  ORF Transcript_77843/g.170512 Transcript_77843/m.170512 type:complete len:881 (-) Transcript_77843:342-2984(-)
MPKGVGRLPTARACDVARASTAGSSMRRPARTSLIRQGPRRWLAALGLLSASSNYFLQEASGQPSGTVTATSTANYDYGTTTVKTSYLDPVKCSLTFDREVEVFEASAFVVSPAEATISHFTRLSTSTYSFSLSASVNCNISIYLPAGAVQDYDTIQNTGPTGSFAVEYYAFAPAASLRLYGFKGLRTNEASNTAYLTFNSTTSINGLSLFDQSALSISPFIEVSDFTMVTTKTFKFSFVLNFTTTETDPTLQCLSPNAELPTENTKMFRCSKCSHAKRCALETVYPPSGLAYQEFPFEMTIAGVSQLGMSATSFEVMYDTLWAAVSLDAPSYAKGPFFLTVAWTEPMDDVSVITPSFSSSGPSVDEEVMNQNYTVINSSAYKVLIAPSETGIVTISINGTSASEDLAGNTNDFRTISASRTGDSKTIIYSSGSPIVGSIAFSYASPAYSYEYEGDSSSTVTSSSLTVTWSGFTTATEYDIWITWGSNLSSEVSANLTTTSHTFANFEALLGIEYIVHLTARNYWGDETIVTKTFLRPSLNVVADGTVPALALPSFMSEHQTSVGFKIFVKENSFLSINELEVLTFRSADLESGDSDPCDAATESLKCTFINFHMEVPDTEFLVFRKPVRLQFNYGTLGWTDSYYRPQLRYWESYREEWMAAADSCPTDTYFEQWNDLHKIYTVAVCHLTQFAIFEYYDRITTTTVVAVSEEDSVTSDPLFFAAFFGAAAAVILFCVVLYLCRKLRHRRRFSSKPDKKEFEELGIKPMTDRVPNKIQVVGRSSSRIKFAGRSGSSLYAESLTGGHEDEEASPSDGELCVASGDEESQNLHSAGASPARTTPGAAGAGTLTTGAAGAAGAAGGGMGSPRMPGVVPTDSPRR